MSALSRAAALAAPLLLLGLTVPAAAHDGS